MRSFTKSLIISLFAVISLFVVSPLFAAGVGLIFHISNDWSFHYGGGLPCGKTKYNITKPCNPDKIWKLGNSPGKSKEWAKKVGEGAKRNKLPRTYYTPRPKEKTNGRIEKYLHTNLEYIPLARHWRAGEFFIL